MNTSTAAAPPLKIVLVCPRKVLEDTPEITLWKNSPQVFERIRNSLLWMKRADAESSNDYIQIIPAAYIENREGKYCVLERVPSKFSYLDRKLSLVSGGHIDAPEGRLRGSHFEEILLDNLRRELQEELGIDPVDPPKPLGMIYTRLSDDSSRHAAFIHQALAQEVFTQAPEEFNSESAINGLFATVERIRELRDSFDPWSKVLIDHLSS